MRKIPVYSIVFAVSFLGIVFFQIGCNKPMEDKVLSKEEMIQRGKYLVEIGGCNDCHSPKMMTDMGPVPDTTRLLSGHPGDHPVTDLDPAMLASKTWVLTNMDATDWVGPWGISYTANLTPDPETGLGNWTDELFIKGFTFRQTYGSWKTNFTSNAVAGNFSVDRSGLKKCFCLFAVD